MENYAYFSPSVNTPNEWRIQVEIWYYVLAILTWASSICIPCVIEESDIKTTGFDKQEICYPRERVNSFWYPVDFIHASEIRSQKNIA